MLVFNAAMVNCASSSTSSFPHKASAASCPTAKGILVKSAAFSLVSDAIGVEASDKKQKRFLITHSCIHLTIHWLKVPAWVWQWMLHFGCNQLNISRSSHPCQHISENSTTKLKTKNEGDLIGRHMHLGVVFCWLVLQSGKFIPWFYTFVVYILMLNYF